MGDRKRFVIYNKYNDNILLEVYKILSKKQTMIINVLQILTILVGLIMGIEEKNNSGSLSLLIVILCFGVVYIYIEINSKKINMKKIYRLKRKGNFVEKLQDKFTFYDSYYVYEKKTSKEQFVNVSYKEISKVYISKNVFILRAPHIKELCIICKDGFELGNVEDFTVFLKQEFKDKVIEVNR